MNWIMLAVLAVAWVWGTSVGIAWAKVENMIQTHVCACYYCGERSTRCVDGTYLCNELDCELRQQLLTTIRQATAEMRTKTQAMIQTHRCQQCGDLATQCIDGAYLCDKLDCECRQRFPDWHTEGREL